MSVIDLATEDNLQYTFYPVSSGSVTFKVRTANDAHVALTTGPEESDPMVEIFIGGWGNTKSIIRSNRTKPDVAEADTPGILNGDEFRSFWVRWMDGVFTVGKEGEAASFLSWQNPAPFHVGHVGVCTGWGATGTWMIEGKYEVHTEDKLAYKFSPVLSGEVEFEFRGPSNCHVALTTDRAETDLMYEVLIGGWENTKSVIRHKRQKPDKVTADTGNIVHHGEYRKFIIQWKAGRIIVRSGMGYGPVIMEWTDDAPFPISHFGVRTAWGSSGQWRIYNSAGQAEPNQTRVQPSYAASAPMMMPPSGGSCWVPARGGEIPPGAVVGGQDGEQLFVGRAQHEGALIPGKIIQSHGLCYIPWGGAEHGKEEYEVLCGCNAMWVPTSGASIPGNALPGGETEEGEPLFVGRAQHEGTLTVGKVQASHGVCYISYGGQELGFQDYEVLTAQ